jgi:site-specific recombinase XerD
MMNRCFTITYTKESVIAASLVFARQNKGRRAMNNLSPIEKQINLDKVRKVFETKDGLTKSTIDKHLYNIKSFLSFISKKQFNRTNFLNFKRELESRRDLSISTKNGHLSAAITFCRQLYLEGALPKDITEGVKLFKQSRGHKKDGVKGNEIIKIATYLAKLKPSLATARLRTLFCLMYYQGFRSVEIAELEFGDLNFTDKTALIRGKGRHDKEPVFLLPQTVKELKKYINLAEIKSGAVMISLSNNSYGKPLSSKGIYNTMMDLMQSAGVYNRCPHGFRHYYVTKQLDIHQDPRMAKKFTRHQSLETLMIYDDRRIMKDDFTKVIDGFNTI